MDRHSRGAYVYQNGNKDTLYPSDVRLEVLEHWESPSGGTYPSRWRLAVDRERLDLTITPLIPDQELNLSFRYWEGAVEVNGICGQKAINGVGYVELTGYAE
jgi:predicted secreted hydrolase